MKINTEILETTFIPFKLIIDVETFEELRNLKTIIGNVTLADLQSHLSSKLSPKDVKSISDILCNIYNNLAPL